MLKNTCQNSTERRPQRSLATDTISTVTEIPLSPFLVSRLEFLSGISQKNVVLLLGVVVLMSLLEGDQALWQLSGN